MKKRTGMFELKILLSYSTNGSLSGYRYLPNGQEYNDSMFDRTFPKSSYLLYKVI